MLMRTEHLCALVQQPQRKEKVALFLFFGVKDKEPFDSQIYNTFTSFLSIQHVIAT